MNKNLGWWCLGFVCSHLFLAVCSARYSVQASVSLPLSEVSGLGRGPKQTLLAVGDKDFKVLAFDDAKPGTEVETWNFFNLLSKYVDQDSQWEAVASDRTGRFFILEEEPGRIFVIDPKKRKLDALIELSVPQSHPLYDDWQSEPNSRGEGMVLLRNGHVLIAKEKKPSALIEFGPRGEPASGYRRGDGVTPSSDFPLDFQTLRTRFYPLKTWALDEDAEEMMEDLSELAVDERGDLFVLSDKSSAIAELGELSVKQKTISWKRVQILPSAIEKAEGLVVRGDELRVACDLKDENDDAVFYLE